MSKDFQIAFPCTHIAIAEPVQLGADRTTLVTVIGAVSVSEVRLNGHLVPPEGLLSAARLTTATRAPFRIYPDATDLKITLTGGLEYVYDLPAGLRSAPEMQALLSTTPNLDVSVPDSGQLVLTDVVAKGPGSRITVSGGASASLGLDRQRGSMGREICPPWGLSVPESGEAPRPRLHYPPKVGKAARWEVTYLMPPDRCRRCMSSRVENDLRFRSNGEPGLISDENLLYQTVMKCLLTSKGSNPYHSWYGTRIAGMVGQKSGSAVVGMIKSDVEQRITELIGIQSTQAKYQGVSVRERIKSVDRLDVRTHESDPTTLLVNLVVRNGSNKQVKIGIVFTTPGTVGTVLRNGKVINRLGGSPGTVVS